VQAAPETYLKGSDTQVSHIVKSNITVARSFIDACLRDFSSDLNSEASREEAAAAASRASTTVRGQLGQRFDREDRFSGPAGLSRTDRVLWLTAKALTQEGIIPTNHAKYTSLMGIAEPSLAAQTPV